MECKNCEAKMIRVRFDPYSFKSLYECPMCGQTYVSNKVDSKKTNFKGSAKK